VSSEISEVLFGKKLKVDGKEYHDSLIFSTDVIITTLDTKFIMISLVDFLAIGS